MEPLKTEYKREKPCRSTVQQWTWKRGTLTVDAQWQQLAKDDLDSSNHYQLFCDWSLNYGPLAPESCCDWSSFRQLLRDWFVWLMNGGRPQTLFITPTHPQLKPQWQFTSTHQCYSFLNKWKEELQWKVRTRTKYATNWISKFSDQILPKSKQKFRNYQRFSFEKLLLEHNMEFSGIKKCALAKQAAWPVVGPPQYAPAPCKLWLEQPPRALTFDLWSWNYKGRPK